ncbi:TonB-dependent hemoglobin/transferrin/lactoferrin family receptor [Luteolibacter sp. LG18]|uniref:TonB-dependent hemoglobin/transferrin/lactoferrin family receptor n=1 Tax=Luteolibacter sp. LG18 TaxID=2819286 RepID=UPI002B28EEBA|nr:heme/hemoglobin uptake outer membrane receptor PhuR [Luteolibacter sp. LG18]
MRIAITACGLAALAVAAAADAPPAAPQEERAPKELDDMVVVATRTEKDWLDTAGTVARLDSGEMVKRGVEDLGGLVKYDPLLSGPFDFASGDGAFAYGGSGYSGFNIRGVEGNRIAVELDGIRQPPQYVSTSFDMGAESGSGGSGRDYFDPAMFDLVEVMKGGGSALYGSDALGGVVSMKTLGPDDLLAKGNAGGLLRTQYFSANESLAVQAGGAIRRGDFEAMLLYAGREGHETVNNGTLPPNPVDFTSGAVLGKLGYRRGENALLLTLESYERNTGSNARSAVISDFPVFNRNVLNAQLMTRQRVGLEWDYEPAGGWIDRLETHAYWQGSVSGSDNRSRSKDVTIGGVTIPGRLRSQSIRFDTGLLGLTSIARKEIQSGGVTHGLLAGIDVSHEDSENTFVRLDTGMPWERDKVSFAPSTTLRLGLFAQDEIAVGRWTVTPGLRVDSTAIRPEPSPGYLARLAALDLHEVDPPTDYDNATPSPRLDVSFKTTDRTRLYAAWSHGIRNPTAEELSMIFEHPASGGSPVGSITVPNPSLQEETSEAFKAGFKGESDAGKIGVEGFYTFYRNYIENGVRTGRQDDEGRDILTTLNRGEAEIYGFEASTEWQARSWNPALDGWSLGVSTGKAIGINRTDDTWLNSVEPWKTVGWLGYDAPDQRHGVRLTAVHSAAVTHVDDSTSQGRFFRPPAWTTLDLSAYWKPTETLTVNAGVNNLFDEKYWSWSSVRRGNGHLGGSATDDRSTAPGTNFHISITRTF